MVKRKKLQSDKRNVRQRPSEIDENVFREMETR